MKVLSLIGMLCLVAASMIGGSVAQDPSWTHIIANVPDLTAFTVPGDVDISPLATDTWPVDKEGCTKMTVTKQGPWKVQVYDGFLGKMWQGTFPPGAGATYLTNVLRVICDDSEYPTSIIPVTIYHSNNGVQNMDIDVCFKQLFTLDDAIGDYQIYEAFTLSAGY